MEKLTDSAQGYCEMYCEKYEYCFGGTGECVFQDEVKMYESLKDYECTGMSPGDIRAMAIAALREREERRWVPFSDPPKEKGCYFVTVKHWIDGNPVAREAYWNGADWLSCEKKQEITPRVTHWMPLPELPKENVL